MSDSDHLKKSNAGSPRSDRRSIRSFVIREGRITRGQQLALETAWPQFGVEFDAKPLDLGSLFEHGNRPITLEIGFGDGEALYEIAARDVQHNFIGIEVHRPGVGHVLMRIQEHGLDNVRIISHDAVDVLESMIPAAALDRINIYFPDPWPKKKHHKRRLIQPEFVKLLANRIKPQGLLHLATDWQPYAEHMLEVLSASEDFVNTSERSAAEGKTQNDKPLDEMTPEEKMLNTACVARPVYRPLTKFERRGHRKGHGVWDFIYTRP